MIQAIAILLAVQLAGDVSARALGLPLPGPVLGMAALVLAFVAMPRLHARIAPTAKGFLSHLSLLFVPAGVGIVGHLARLGTDGGPLLLAVLISTLLATVVGGAVFALVARATGTSAP